MKAAYARFLEMRLKARTGIWIEALGLLLAMLCGYAAVTYLLDRNLRLEWPFRLVMLAVLLFYVGRMLRRRLLRPLATRLSDDEMAIAVERAAPEVKQALISSVQFERALGSGVAVVESRAMMAAVVDEIGSRLASIPFLRALDAARVRRFAAVLAAGVLAFAGWGLADFQSLKLWALRNLAIASVPWPRYTTFSFAEFGDGTLRVPQGDPLTVAVAVQGPIPDQVFLYYRFAGGESGAEPMSATGERDFSWTMQAVLEDGDVWIEGGDGLSATLHLQVVERPRIEQVAVRVFYPEYMHKEPDHLPATESDVKVPRGGRLELAARSHKPITEAFLLVGTDRKLPLQRDDQHAFHGEFVPEATSLIELNVIDTDKLGASSPPKLMVRIVDDRPPTLDLRLRGIGQLITPYARIPGDLKVKDDFGVTAVAAGARWMVDNAGEQKAPGEPSEPPAEVPFEEVEVNYGSDLSPGAVRYESTAVIDLLQLDPDQKDQNAAGNKLRPGMLLTLRYSAKDNYGPKAPHENFSELITFRVVSSDKLLDELRRRQIEQRTELQQILDEERTAQVEIKEMLNPSSDNEKAGQARARLRALSRQQTALGRRVGFVGVKYGEILLEYENNRMWDSLKVRQVEAAITAPLEALAKGDFPVTSRQVQTFSSSGEENLRTEIVASYDQICRRIEDILKKMEDAETLAALLESLRNLINVEDSAIRGVEKRLQEEAERIFGPDKGRDDKPQDKPPEGDNGPKPKK